MRVLLVSRPSSGGAARHVLDVVRGLAGRHRIAALVCADEDPRYPAALASAGAEIRILRLARGPRPLSDLLALLGIRRALVTLRPDLVHAHAAKAGALARAAAGAVPVAYSPHGFYHHYPTAPPAARRAALAAERGLAGRTAALVCAAAWEREAAIREGLGRPGRTFLVPNGVPPADPLPPAERDALRRELGLREGEALALMAGRAAAPKDPATFLAAAPSLAGTVRMAFAGDGPDLPALREKAGPALLLGHRDDVGRLLGAADVAVLATRFEAAPYFLLQAMAAGVPVAAADLPATREALQDAGTFFPAGDAGALAAAVREIVEAPDRGAGKGRRGRARAETCHSVARMLSATERVWELISSRRAPAPSGR